MLIIKGENIVQNKYEQSFDNASINSLIFDNINDETELFFDINEDSITKICFLQTNKVKNIKISAKVRKNAQFAVFFADFSDKEINLITDINLVEEGAKCDWHLSSLSKDCDRKNFEVSIYHKAKNTISKIDNFGVCKNKSKMVFSGICKIFNGCSESNANQNAKIIVFDDEAIATAKPILKIDENDVMASHAAVVGKISDDLLFYLTSKGISLEHARELITFGYLKPILLGFDSNEYKDRIENIIQGEF